MPIWTLGMDVTGVVQGTAQVERALNAQGDSLKDAVVEMSVYNAKAKVWEQTIKGTTTNGAEFLARFRQNAAGIAGLKDVKLVFVDPNVELKKQLREAEAARLASDRVILKQMRERLAEEARLARQAAKDQAAENTKIRQAAQANRQAATRSGYKPEEEDATNPILDRIPRVASIQLIKQAINAMVHEIVSGTEEAIKFQTEISQIRTIANGANTSFSEWAATIRGISDAFGENQVDVAQAAIKALSSQVVQSKTEVQGFVSIAAQFGQITGGTAVQGVEALSAATRAFGTDASTAQQTAEKLFAVMSNTGATVTELASAFQHSGAEAKLLGLNMEEFGATLVTLTSKGVSFGDATSFINELLIKLAKPSKEMKELFSQLGVASGQALLQTYGFEGGIQKLVTAAHGAVPELAALFDSLHGAKGITGVSLLKDFQDSLEKIKNSADKYSDAAKIIIESPGKQIQIEIQKIKNYFIDDLGTTTLGTINELSKVFGGLANAIENVTKSAIVVISTWATYKVSIQAATISTQLYAQAVGYSSIALHNAIPFIGLAIASYTAFSLILRNVKTAADELQEGLDALAKKHSNEGRVNFIDTSDLTRYKDDVGNIFQAVEKTLAGAFTNASNRLTTLRDSTREIGRDLEVGFQGALNTLGDGIKGIGKHIAEANDEIKKSSKSTVDFQRSLEDGLRQEQNKYATPQQKFSFNSTYIRQLQEEIRKEYASGDKDQIEDARKKFDEIAKLERENFQIQVDIAKKGGGYIAVSIQQLKYQYQDLATLREQYEAGYRANLRASLVDLNALDAKEKERVKAIQLAIKEFTDLEKKVTDGTLDKNKAEDKQFFDKDGQVDVQKVKDKLQDRAALIIAQLGAAGAEQIKIARSINDQVYGSAVQLNGQIVDLEKAKNQQILNLGQVLATQNLQQTIAAKQREVEEVKAITLKAASDFQAAIGELSKGLSDKDGGLSQAKADVDNIIKSIKAFGQELGGQWFVSKEAIKDLYDVKLAANSLRDQLQALGNVSKQSLKTPEGQEKFKNDLNAAKNSYSELLAKYEQFLKIKSGNPNANIWNTLIGEGANARPAAVLFKDLEEQFQLVQQLEDKAGTTQKTYAAASVDVASILSNATGALAVSLNETFTAGNTAESALKTNFTNVKSYIKDVNNEIDRMNAKINGMTLKGVLLQLTPVDANIPSTPTGPAETGKAGGGFLFGPRGVDNIPAWLSQGEFVMNAAATDMYRPILESMNQSKRPGYYESGGYVTTNVGDININYTSSGKAETDVRKIGNLLQREIKRGNVRLR